MNELLFKPICSVPRDYKFRYNLTETAVFFNSSSVLASEVKVLGIGTSSGLLLLIAFIVHVILFTKLKKTKQNVSSLKTLKKLFNAKNLTRTFLLTVLVLLTPLVTMFLLIALLYKVLCSVVIKRKDKYFVEFLNSFDVFWSLEDDATKSIINVLGIIESDSPNAIADKIKEKLVNIFPDNGTKKIFYRRNEGYGFYYWRKYSTIDINQYVETIEFPENSNDPNVADLEALMTDIQDQPLPYDDKGLFKILITKQRISNHNEVRGEYGIIFRIHHSVGDGVALIEFLCQTFADKTDSCTVEIISSPEIYNNRGSAHNLLDMMQKLCEIPLCFVDGLLRKSDNNSIHGPTLLGKKLFKWTQSDENLLAMVKNIKESVDQLNFTDVLLTALASGLQNFFLKTVTPIPEDVAVILPIRFPKLSAVDDMKLENNFSVTILDIPVKSHRNLYEVKNRCKQLRSSDALTNYYFLMLVTSVLPKSMLQPILSSSQATTVFSNMPGPEYLSICGGQALKSLVFFVPHKGSTGLGVTALCYGGVLRFAAMADVALVSKPQELALILDGMVDEIKRLHKQRVR